MQEVKLQFRSILQNEFPPKDGEYMVASISPIDTGDVLLLNLWWDSESKKWYSSNKEDGGEAVEFSTTWYFGDWWCEPCKIGLENKYSIR